MNAMSHFHGTGLDHQSQLYLPLDTEDSPLDIDNLFILDPDRAESSIPSALPKTPDEKETGCSTDLKEKEIAVIPAGSAQNQRSSLSVFTTYTLAVAGTGFLRAFLAPKISEFATQKLGFCLGNFFSKSGIDFLWSLEKPLGQLNHMIGSFFGNNLSSSIVIPAFLEEVEFRWFVQDILFKTLPKKIIEQISPKIASLVDSLPAKVSRIFATTAIFALIHAHVLECEDGGGATQLIGGLLYGSIYEFGDSLVHTVNAHILYNFFCKAIAELL